MEEDLFKNSLVSDMQITAEILRNVRTELRALYRGGRDLVSVEERIESLRLQERNLAAKLEELRARKK